jgi:chemotaxis protein methyltransferase CheR
MLNKDSEYEFLREFIFKNAGVILDKEKNYLIDSRLKPLLRKNSLNDLSCLVKILESANNNDIATHVINALTTHETYFFRDKEPFRVIKETIIPKLIENRSKEKQLRIWSAACSSGQEIYSTAMIISEMGLHLKNWKINLIGTDVSTPILEKARNAIYTEHEVNRGLDIDLKNKYFRKTNQAEWKISLPENVKVEFLKLNLFDDFNKLGKFDLILLRNVLIYFDLKGKSNILTRMHSSLNANGVLLLGTAETTTGIVDCFEKQVEAKVIYYKK